MKVLIIGTSGTGLLGASIGESLRKSNPKAEVVFKSEPSEGTEETEVANVIIKLESEYKVSEFNDKLKKGFAPSAEGYPTLD